MEKTVKQLENENERLKEALREICKHISGIKEAFESVSDLLEKEEECRVTKEDVKKLLKKYSSL